MPVIKLPTAAPRKIPRQPRPRGGWRCDKVLETDKFNAARRAHSLDLIRLSTDLKDDRPTTPEAIARERAACEKFFKATAAWFAECEAVRWSPTDDPAA